MLKVNVAKGKVNQAIKDFLKEKEMEYSLRINWSLSSASKEQPFVFLYR